MSSDASSVDGWVGVEWSDDDLELGLNSLGLLRVTAQQGDCSYPLSCIYMYIGQSTHASIRVTQLVVHNTSCFPWYIINTSCGLISMPHQTYQGHGLIGWFQVATV